MQYGEKRPKEAMNKSSHSKQFHNSTQKSSPCIRVFFMRISWNRGCSVPSNFDTRERFVSNITSFTSIVINYSVSYSCNDHSHHYRYVSSLVSSCVANLTQRVMAKQLLTPLRLIAPMNVSLKNYCCKLFKAAITRRDLSSRFFCIDATLLCEFESDKI